jgi:putative oxidoreductase
LDRYLGKYSEQIYSLARIVIGFMYMWHGVDKFMRGSPAGSLQWFAGLIEIAAGALICIGLMASWAAFIASGQMAVAYFMVHQPQALLPLVNRGELAAAYCWFFLYVAAKGAGIWSLDAVFTRPAAAESSR